MAKPRPAIRGLAVCLCLLLAGLAPGVGLPADEYHLAVFKQDRELLVKRGDSVVRKYRVAVGRGGVGTKHRRGDDITPTGVYHIVDLRSESKFHYFMQLSYPNLRDAMRGYDNRLITAEEFTRIARAYAARDAPPQDTPLGGAIGIHGIGATTGEKLSIHEVSNWTDGCIALTNQEVIDLRQYVRIGTRVEIND